MEYWCVELCNSHSSNVDISVHASNSWGQLVISGCDHGKFPQEFWGDSEYNYQYKLDAEGFKRLLKAIDGEDDPRAAIVREFSGIDGCKYFREVCKREGIEYSFFSISG